jgi:hypothetical protein
MTQIFAENKKSVKISVIRVISVPHKNKTNDCKWLNHSLIFTKILKNVEDVHSVLKLFLYLQRKMFKKDFWYIIKKIKIKELIYKNFKNMRQTIIILIFTLFTTTAFAQVKLRHGLILGGGGGNINYAKLTNSELWAEKGTVNLFTGYKYNAMLGYKFRIKPLNRKTFFDIDITAGIKRIEYWTSLRPIEEQSNFYFIPNNYYTCSSASLAFSYNYQTHGLYVGAGVEPTYYYDAARKLLNNEFDVPVFVKIGYELKFIDISVSYKKGITSMLDDKDVKNGRINDLQVQMFIPF